MNARRSSLAALCGMAVCLLLQVDAGTPAAPLAGFDADVEKK